MTWTQYHLLKTAHDAMSKELEVFRMSLIELDLEELAEVFSYKYKVVVMDSDGLKDFDREVMVFSNSTILELSELRCFSYAELSDLTDEVSAVVYDLD